MTTPPGGWLDPEQQRAWLAFIRLQLRITYEMNRQLQADSGLSLADWDVLTALGERAMSVTALATQIGWERSRVSHQTKRMATRGLVEMSLATHDRRVTSVSLTAAGRAALEAAAPGHVELVRSLVFDGLDPAVVRQLAEGLETIFENVLSRGSLPRPPL